LERTNFIISYKYKDIFNDLSDKQAGVLIKAIFKYQHDGAIAGFGDAELKMAFRFIKNDMDYNNKKYEEICEKNKKNINKRWKKKVVDIVDNSKPIRPYKKNTTVLIKKSIDKYRKNGTGELDEKTPLYDRIFGNTKNTDNDVDVDNEDDNENDKDKDCVSALQKHYVPQNFSGKPLPKSQTELPALKAPPALAANKQQTPTKKLYAKQASTPPKTAQKALAPNGRQATIEHLTPQTKAFEFFKAIYERETGEPYAKKQSEFILLANLIKLHGIYAVERKIKILSIGCKNAVFWFTKNGFSDFTIGKLSLMWNNLIPIETEEQKKDRIESEKTKSAAKRVYEEREKEKRERELNHTKIQSKL
jgi:hypothetical protein